MGTAEHSGGRHRVFYAGHCCTAWGNVPDDWYGLYDYRRGIGYGLHDGWRVGQGDVFLLRSGVAVVFVRWSEWHIRE